MPLPAPGRNGTLSDEQIEKKPGSIFLPGLFFAGESEMPGVRNR
jgi:hypothetical protein